MALAQVKRKSSPEQMPSVAGLSDSAFCKLVKWIRDQPEVLDELPTHRLQMYRANAKVLNAIRHEITLKTKNGDFAWVVAHPEKILAFFCSVPPFAALLRDTIRAARGDALRIVLEYDEVTPGNVLAPDTRRKFWAVYWSVLEFREKLSMTSVWMPFGVLRSGVVKTVLGKFSHVFAQMVRCFAHECRFDVGVPIDCPSGPMLLRAVPVAINLGDADALKQGLDIKGSAGMLPCGICRNCCKKGSRLPAANEYFVDICCADVALFDARSNKDVYDCADQLSSLYGTLTKGKFEDAEKMRGLNFNADGVLFANDLRDTFEPASSFTYDPMHCYVSNGVANVELALLMKSLKTANVTWQHLRDYVKDAGFKWPSGLQNTTTSALHECFNEARETGSKKIFKSSASETLMVVPVVRYFLSAVVETNRGCAQALRLELLSFGGLADCIALVVDAKHAKSQPELLEIAGRLAEANENHQKAFMAAYGSKWCRPKHHFRMHVPQQVVRNGVWLDCWTLERNNRFFKACALHCFRLQSFESAVLVRAVRAQCRYMADALEPGVKLLGSTTQVGPLTFAKQARYGPQVFGHGDVVMSCAREKFAVVEMCSTDMLVVRPLVAMDVTATYARCELKAGNCEAWSCSRTEVATCWRLAADGSFVILYRGCKKRTYSCIAYRLQAACRYSIYYRIVGQCVDT